MKVTIETLADFLGELEMDAKSIMEGTVRIRQVRDPVNEVVWDVEYVVTAVVSDSSGGGFLIRYREACGQDVVPDTDGSNRMSDDIEIITEKCDQLGLHVRPGEIEL